MSMAQILTRSTARALLTNLRAASINDKLPEDVLLEIFDVYRQLYELQSGYEKLWNGRWFRLAHVCQSWRRVVLFSASRLHLHLVFTPRRSSRVTMLRHLPPLPIFVDYSASSRTEKEEKNLEIAAIRHRGRVRGIDLRKRYADMAKLLRALGDPFPELEFLKIRPTHDYHRDMVLPATFLSGSAPSLQRLKLRGVAPSSFSWLLSSAMGLVELSLTVYDSPPEDSFLTNLQHMSCLRRLELNWKYRAHTTYFDSDPPPPCDAGYVVPLSQLTHVFFTGHRICLQRLVAGLAAPSLQRLDAEVCGKSRGTLPIPHFCKFICDTEFAAVRLGFTNSKLRFCARTGSQSVHDLPFRIIIPGPVSLEQMGQELSRPLSTVEELIIAWDVEPWFTEGHVQADEWRGFFYHIRQVKMVRVPAKAALDVAHAFQQNDLPVMDLLPALDRIEVLSVVDRDDLYESVCGAFEPLIAARQLAGHPIRLSWTFWKNGFPQKWCLVRYCL